MGGHGYVGTYVPTFRNVNLATLISSEKNTVPNELQFQRALNEASEDEGVEEFFRKLFNIEKGRMKSVWGFIGSGKYTFKICGLKFNLLPDIGRHHKAAHMERNQDGRPSGKKTGDAQRMKSGRVSRPTFKKIAAETSNKSKNKENANSKRRTRKIKSPETNIVEVEENQNIEVAKNMSSEGQTILN